jgi:hypothetical protein
MCVFVCFFNARHLCTQAEAEREAATELARLNEQARVRAIASAKAREEQNELARRAAAREADARTAALEQQRLAAAAADHARRDAATEAAAQAAREDGERVRAAAAEAAQGWVAAERATAAKAVTAAEAEKVTCLAADDGDCPCPFSLPPSFFSPLPPHFVWSQR